MGISAYNITSSRNTSSASSAAHELMLLNRQSNWVYVFALSTPKSSRNDEAPPVKTSSKNKNHTTTPPSIASPGDDKPIIVYTAPSAP